MARGAAACAGSMVAPALGRHSPALLAPCASRLHVGGLDLAYEYQPNGFLSVHASAAPGARPPPELLLADHGFTLVGAQGGCWRASNLPGHGFQALLWQLHVLRLGEAAAAEAKAAATAAGTWPGEQPCRRGAGSPKAPVSMAEAAAKRGPRGRASASPPRRRPTIALVAAANAVLAAQHAFAQARSTRCLCAAVTESQTGALSDTSILG